MRCFQKNWHYRKNKESNWEVSKVFTQVRVFGKTSKIPIYFNSHYPCNKLAVWYKIWFRYIGKTFEEVLSIAHYLTIIVNPQV